MSISDLMTALTWTLVSCLLSGICLVHVAGSAVQRQCVSSLSPANGSKLVALAQHYELFNDTFMKWTFWTKQCGVPHSILATADHDNHIVRWSALNPFPSAQSVHQLPPAVVEWVDALLDTLVRFVKTHRPSEMKDTKVEITSTKVLHLLNHPSLRNPRGEISADVSDPSEMAPLSKLDLRAAREPLQGLHNGGEVSRAATPETFTCFDKVSGKVWQLSRSTLHADSGMATYLVSNWSSLSTTHATAWARLSRMLRSSSCSRSCSNMAEASSVRARMVISQEVSRIRW